jgi:hypothetical protein
MRLTEVNLGGQSRPFRFGFNAIEVYCNKTNTPLHEFGSVASKLVSDKAAIGILRDFVWAGLCGGCMSKGLTIDFTNFQVGDWMDECDGDTITNLIDTMVESMYTTEKKKVTDSQTNQ